MTDGGPSPPLIMHILFRFDTGGLENGVVNLINNMPVDAFRHMVVALTTASPTFSARIRREGVIVHALHKPPGHGVRVYRALYQLCRKHRPAIVHTRNLAALEAAVPAWAARVPLRIHGEHGRDADDLDGSSRKYRLVRRLYSPFVSSYITLSQDLERYLVDKTGIGQQRITQIYNGVDAQRFSRSASAEAIDGCPFDPNRHWIVGSVGRMQPVKDPLLLAQAFVRALELAPSLRPTLRLVMVGDGPLRRDVQAFIDRAQVADMAWLPGERSDIPVVMRGLHGFALPSRAEGISNTILEAMATGLPVLATRVGGNAELVVPDVTGVLVPAADPEAMARRLIELASNSTRARELGLAGRREVERRFSLSAMVNAYQHLYEEGLRTVAPRLARA
jgi:sugar transferase (PEP-CTERM/EpsH1 system associated)